MIDTNVHLFRWPFRRLPADDPQELVLRLKTRGVEQAWAGSYEALLNRDVRGVNDRLTAACRRYGAGYLIPFGCVNPMLRGWEEDLQRCREVHGMAGIRLYPNYHSYALDHPAFVKLLSQAADRRMIVQIALSMEDTRTQFPLMHVPPTDPKPLAGVLPKIPELKLMLLNAGYWTGDDAPEIRTIRSANNVWLDISMNEGIGGLDRLVAATSTARIVFGSHAPFFYFEAALLKVLSSDLPPKAQVEICMSNARHLMQSALSNGAQAGVAAQRQSVLARSANALG